MKSKIPHIPVEFQRVNRAIAIVLLPLLISDASPRLNSATQHGPTAGRSYPNDERDNTHPYLLVIGPAPLRFAPEPPHNLPKSAPPAPPPPAVPDKESTIEAANRQAAANVEATLVEPAPIPPSTLISAKPKPSVNELQPLIPDDTRRQVRPEDILPFFSFPGNGANGGLIIGTPPEPAAPRDKLPTSSATYIQK